MKFNRNIVFLTFLSLFNLNFISASKTESDQTISKNIDSKTIKTQDLNSQLNKNAMNKIWVFVKSNKIAIGAGVGLLVLAGAACPIILSKVSSGQENTKDNKHDHSHHYDDTDPEIIKYKEQDDYPLNANLGFLRVKKLGWGKIVIQNKDNSTQEFKDCKLWLDKVEVWNWKKCRTNHKPDGISIKAFEDFIDQVDEIVLSRGVQAVLQIKPEVTEHLKSLGKTVHVAQTPEAANLYNKLYSEGKKVGALLHSTC